MTDYLADVLRKKFSERELDVLGLLDLEARELFGKRVWGTQKAYAGQPNDIMITKTQLGLSAADAKRLIIRYLDALQPYSFDDVTWYLEHRGRE